MSPLGLLFPRIALLSPTDETAAPETARAVSSGRLLLHGPNDRNDEVRHRAMECIQWAQYRAGTDLAALAAGLDRMAEEDAGSAHDIRDELASIMGGRKTDEPEDPVLRARIFLAVAEDFDARQAELRNGLRAAEKMERRLFDDLAGDPDRMPLIPLSGVTAPDDPGAQRTRERISAWRRLHASLLPDTAYPFWLTTSPAVHAALAEDLAVGSEAVCGIAGIAVDGDAGLAEDGALTGIAARIADELERLPGVVSAGAGPVRLDAGQGGGACLEIFRVPQPPADGPQFLGLMFTGARPEASRLSGNGKGSGAAEAVF